MIGIAGPATYRSRPTEDRSAPGFQVKHTVLEIDLDDRHTVILDHRSQALSFAPAKVDLLSAAAR